MSEFWHFVFVFVFVFVFLTFDPVSVVANDEADKPAESCVSITFKQLRENALEFDGRTICINGFLARTRVHRSGDYFVLYENQATYLNWEEIRSEASREDKVVRRIAILDALPRIEAKRAFYDRRYVRVKGEIDVDCALDQPIVETDNRVLEEICVGNFSDAPKLRDPVLVDLLSDQAMLRFPGRGYEEYQIAELSWKYREFIQRATRQVLSWVAKESVDENTFCRFFAKDEESCRLGFRERDDKSSLLNWFLYQNERALGELLKANHQPKITILKEIPPESMEFQEAFGCVCKDKVCDESFLPKTDTDIDNQVFADPYYCIPFWSEDEKPWRAGLAF